MRDLIQLFLDMTEIAIETHIMRYHVDNESYQYCFKRNSILCRIRGPGRDQGIIIGEEFELQVIDTQKDGDHIIHFCQFIEDFAAYE